MTMIRSRPAIPLRSPHERVQFVDQYFAAVGATLLRSSVDYREFELPREVDKELTDRPYYWLWVEKTDQQVEPTVLRMAFTEEALARENERLRQTAQVEMESKNPSDTERMFFRPPTAELVTLGSFRLDKLYQSLANRGRFACVKPAGQQPGILVPWLMYNVQVSYRCDLVEQEIYSVGVCLTNGQVVENFYDMIQRLHMNQVDPHELLPEVKLSVHTAMRRVQEYLEDKLKRRSHEWAQTALLRLEKELRQIATYYQSLLPDLQPEEQVIARAEQRRKERELTERTGPTIELIGTQVALVGLFEPRGR